MATYNQVSYGSQGSDVTKLQKLLNNNGYSLDIDGNFGSKTQAAVKDYQKKNGLDVDGIVGKNTWGKLTEAQSGPAESTPTATEPADANAPSFAYGAYEKSDVVKQAEAMLQQHLANKPGDYTSPWQAQLDETLNKILNREKFSYDLNGDALYQQYKDQYTTNGKMAMMDTMGQAQAMTGGYGNSYAQSVGQQAYQGYLQQLNDRIPELYQLALDQYNRDGDEMYNQASIMASMEEKDYGRYRDNVSDYNTELDRLTEDARYQGELDYSQWLDNRNLKYQQERDKVADEQWQAEFNEAKRQYDQQYARSLVSSSNPGQQTGDGLTEDQIKTMQRELQVEADGVWGPETQKAAKQKWGVSSAEDAWDWYQEDKEDRYKYTQTKNMTYNDIKFEVDALINGKAEKSEIKEYIEGARDAGIITPKECEILRFYASNGWNFSMV